MEYRTENQLAMVNARRPHFLEVFLPNLSSERLKIPSKFIRHLAGKTSGFVSLTGPSGSSWHVGLIEHNGHLYLDDGWPAFVKDHSIECGDSLVFGYDGNLDFTVQIFDQTSCEKEETFYAKCSQELSDLSRNLANKRERDGEAAFSSVFGEKRMRGSWIPGHLNFKAGNKEDNLTSSDEGQELKGSVTNGYGNRTGNVVEASERSFILALPVVTDDQVMAIVMNSQRNRSASNLKKACSKKKKTDAEKKTSISKFIEEKAAHYFTSSFPYFVRVMKFSNVNDRSTMKVPVRFSMAHFPNCRIKVTLRNLNGDYWMLNAVPTTKRQSTMHTFSGGWLAFVRGNKIKKDDVCIFELVDKFEMRVHILRLGLEGVESETQKSSIDVCGLDVGVGSGGFPLKSAENVWQDNVVHTPKVSERTNEPCTYDNEEDEKDSEMIPGPPQEAASSSDTSDDATVLTTPVNIAPSPMSRAHNKREDQLLGCNAEGTVSYQTSRKSQADLDAICATQMPVTAEDAGAPLSFTSPFPNFMKVMMSSNVGGSFTLAIPRKFSSAYLPSYRTEIVLRNVKGDCWNVTSSRYGHQTKFCGGWMSFVRQNVVKMGDICVFELVDERVLQVHIFQATQRVLECPSNDAAGDDSTASVESTQCTVLRGT